MTEQENCGWEELAHDALDWVIASGNFYFLIFFISSWVIASGNFYFSFVLGSLRRVIFNATLGTFH